MAVDGIGIVFTIVTSSSTIICVFCISFFTFSFVLTGADGLKDFSLAPELFCHKFKFNFHIPNLFLIALIYNSSCLTKRKSAKLHTSVNFVAYSVIRFSNWSHVDKSVKQVRHQNPMISLAGTLCTELLTDLQICTGAFILHWSPFEPAHFRSRACLTMPSLCGITIYRIRLRPFKTLIISAQVI